MNQPSARRKQVHQFKEPARQNPYRSQTKPRGTPKCPTCNAVCVRGRWISALHLSTVQPSLLITSELKCPSCRQLEDHFAMGVVELCGENSKEKKELIMNTVRRTEEIARIRNDQERVLWIQEMKGGVTKIYVSLPELARHIGREIEKSFQGKTEYEHSTEEPYLRVRWDSDLLHMKHRPGASFVLEKKARSRRGTA